MYFIRRPLGRAGKTAYRKTLLPGGGGGILENASTILLGMTTLHSLSTGANWPLAQTIGSNAKNRKHGVEDKKRKYLCSP